MKLRVDKDKCISCGRCVSYTEEVFEFDEDNQAKVIETPVSEGNVEIATKAMEDCPTGAIEEE